MLLLPGRGSGGRTVLSGSVSFLLNPWTAASEQDSPGAARAHQAPSPRAIVTRTGARKGSAPIVTRTATRKGAGVGSQEQRGAAGSGRTIVTRTEWGL